MAKIFISHSSHDKRFARKLSRALSDCKHEPWLDEASIKVGESIVKKINEGLSTADFVVLILTKHAIESKWVEREWIAKYWQEVQDSTIRVLPVLVEYCDIPALLQDKKYADFRSDFDRGFAELLASIDPTSNEVITRTDDKFLHELAALLARAHSLERLSALLVDTLPFALGNNQKALYTFCSSELSGYHDREKDTTVSMSLRPYRVVEFFASKTGRLNTMYHGFSTATGVFQYLERNPDKFVPITFIENDGISELEHKAAQQTRESTALELIRPYGSLNADAENPDRKVYCYARPDSYVRVLQGIRRKYVEFATALLPSL